MSTIREISRVDVPFDTTGVVRGADGLEQYSDLPDSVPAMLRARVDEHPEREAVGDVGGDVLDYARLWERASRVAGGLRARGVVEGDRIAIRLPAGTDWVVGFFGILLAGGVVVAVNTRLSEPEIQYILDDAGVALSLDPGVALPDGEPYEHRGAHLDDLAALFYTSGTTGAPKGARITHRNFLTNIENGIRGMALARDLGAGFRTLISVPLFHVTGCNSQLLATLRLGGTALILPALDIPTMLATIGEQRISWLVSVPAVYQLLIAHPSFGDADVSTVRYLGYGGAPITPDAVRAIAEAFPAAALTNGYGCTETSSLTSVLPHTHTVAHADSVGFPVPVVDLALAVDTTDDSGQVGELLVRGPNVISGYWNKPEATAAAFVDGWFRTGDIVRIDDAGLLYVLDRIKDMVNRGGENVYCVEVENALASAPGVVESAVCAVPDSVMGEKVGAVVVTRTDVTAEQIVADLRGRLADFKIPQYLVLQRDPLPRTAAGKIRKSDLGRDTAWGAPLR